MSKSKWLRFWLTAIGVVAFAQLAVAQTVPGGGMHEHPGTRGSAEWEACRKQADDQRLVRGDQRRAFMDKCLQSNEGDKDPAKGQALRDKMRQGQGDHLHSDAPPAAAPAAPATPQAQ